MKTAIITGASSGLGELFTLKLEKYFPEIEAVWLIARRRERMESIAQKLKGKKVEILPLDLCDNGCIADFAEKLEQERPEIALLINNAGCGYLANVGEGDLADQTRMVDLNVRALTAVTHIAIPYMTSGSRILNVSSIASFCPNARMTVYSSTKAYVSSFTRGLATELRGQGIAVTAVCPGPMKTEFLALGNITGNSKQFERLPSSDPELVVEGALAAVKAGRVIYTPRAFFKLYRLLAKILPHSFVVHLAKC